MSDNYAYTSDNYVDVSDKYVDPSDNYVDASDNYVDLLVVFLCQSDKLRYDRSTYLFDKST